MTATPVIAVGRHRAEVERKAAAAVFRLPAMPRRQSKAASLNAHTALQSAHLPGGVSTAPAPGQAVRTAEVTLDARHRCRICPSQMAPLCLIWQPAPIDLDQGFLHWPHSLSLAPSRHTSPPMSAARLAEVVQELKPIESAWAQGQASNGRLNSGKTPVGFRHRSGSGRVGDARVQCSKLVLSSLHPSTMSDPRDPLLVSDTPTLDPVDTHLAHPASVVVSR